MYLRALYTEPIQCDHIKVHSSRPLPQIHSFVISEFPVCHVSMVTDDLPNMLWGHVFLLCLDKPKFPFLGVPLGLQLLPFASYMHILSLTTSYSAVRCYLSLAVSPQREAGKEGRDIAVCAAVAELCQPFYLHLHQHKFSTAMHTTSQLKRPQEDDSTTFALLQNIHMRNHMQTCCIT